MCRDDGIKNTRVSITFFLNLYNFFFLKPLQRAQIILNLFKLVLTLCIIIDIVYKVNLNSEL